MGNRILSQEEIEVLLNGAQQNEISNSNDDVLLDMEKDTIGEIANISMGNAATTLSLLLSKKVEITTPVVTLMKSYEISSNFPGPAVMVKVDYKEGIEGFNFFILSQSDAAIIVDLMMGGDGKPQTTELNELQISGVAEAMNQMMGAAATSMSSMFNQKVDITPPEVQVTDLATDEEIQKLLKQIEPLVQISFRLHVEDVIDSVLKQVIPLRVVKGMVETMLQSLNTNEIPSIEEILPDNSSLNEYIENDLAATTLYQNQGTTAVQPARFGQLKPIRTENVPENLDLILDVPLQVSVELGKAKKTIRDIMNLGPGAVIELDRVAGEPVDMIVNGKLIAKCEVVVINETFGIRITDIVQPAERLKTIK